MTIPKNEDAVRELLCAWNHCTEPCDYHRRQAAAISALTQQREAGVTVELVIPTPGAIKTFARPATKRSSVLKTTDSNGETE
jgi:hypothetical protein